MTANELLDEMLKTANIEPKARYSLQEVASMFCLPYQRTLRLVNTGALPSLRLSPMEVAVFHGELLEYIEECRSRSGPGRPRRPRFAPSRTPDRKGRES